jgi:hypothetical protein
LIDCLFVCLFASSFSIIDTSWVSRAQGIWQNDAVLLYGAKHYFSNSKRFGDQLGIVAELPNGVAWVYPSIYADPKGIPAVAIPIRT